MKSSLEKCKIISLYGADRWLSRQFVTILELDYCARVIGHSSFGFNTLFVRIHVCASGRLRNATIFWGEAALKFNDRISVLKRNNDGTNLSGNISEAEFCNIRYKYLAFRPQFYVHKKEMNINKYCEILCKIFVGLCML